MHLFTFPAINLGFNMVGHHGSGHPSYSSIVGKKSNLLMFSWSKTLHPSFRSSACYVFHEGHDWNLTVLV